MRETISFSTYLSINLSICKSSLTLANSNEIFNRFNESYDDTEELLRIQHWPVSDHKKSGYEGCTYPDN